MNLQVERRAHVTVEDYVRQIVGRLFADYEVLIVKIDSKHWTSLPFFATFSTSSSSNFKEIQN